MLAGKTLPIGQSNLERLHKITTSATRAKSDMHHYLQEYNTSVVVDNGKQIIDVVFADLDKDNRALTCCFIWNGGR